MKDSDLEPSQVAQVHAALRVIVSLRVIVLALQFMSLSYPLRSPFVVAECVRVVLQVVVARPAIQVSCEGGGEWREWGEWRGWG